MISIGKTSSAKSLNFPFGAITVDVADTWNVDLNMQSWNYNIEIYFVLDWIIVTYIIGVKDENLPIIGNTFLGFAFHIWSGSLRDETLIVESAIVNIEGQFYNGRIKVQHTLFHENIISTIQLQTKHSKSGFSVENLLAPTSSTVQYKSLTGY